MAFTETINRLLPKNRFICSVSILAGGTAAGQAIIVLASPLLTRLYSPEDFGLLGVYAALLLIIGVVVSLRYQLAIPLPEDDQEAAHIAVLSLLLVVGTTLLTGLAVLFFRQPIADVLNIPALARYLWLLPLGLLLLGIYQVFNYWAIRTNAFPAIARTKLTQSLSMVAMQLGGYAVGPLALLLGQVAGQAAGSTSLGMLAIRKSWPAFQAVRFPGVLKAARRYRRFPKYDVPAAALNALSLRLPPVLLAALFSPAVAGFYMLAERVLAMPMSMVGQAVGQVLYGRSREAIGNGQLGRLTRTIVVVLSSAIVFPAVLVFIFGQDLFSLVFGSAWREAGIYASWMIFGLAIQFIYSPISVILMASEDQHVNLYIHAFMLVAKLFAIGSGLYLGDPLFAVIGLAISGGIGYGIAILIVIARAEKHNFVGKQAEALRLNGAAGLDVVTRGRA